ncbi:hypothetical protein D044_0862A, partial [Vibrio parahaemolyticus EKP-026]
MPLRALTKP